MTQIRLWVVVCALVCVCSVASQKTEIQFINNCFNVDGGVLFCLKTGVQSCDSKWFYQILTPPDELGTSFVLDTQIVLSGESSTQCYPVSHHENQCQYCVGFIDSEVGSDGSLRVALHVDLYCGDSTVSYPHNIMRVQGQRCGEPEYYYLPCDAQDNCILVGEGENSELFCPTVLVDTCATSYVGLVATIDGFSTVVSTGNMEPICTDLSVGSLCVTADILMITDEAADNFQTVTTNIQACIRNDSDEGSPCEIASVVVNARYPRCGFALEDGCQIVEHVYQNDPVFTQSVHDQNSDDHHNNHPVIIDYANSDSEVDVGLYEDSGSNLWLTLILVAVISAVGLCFVLSAVGIYLVVRSRKQPASQYELVSYYY